MRSRTLKRRSPRSSQQRKGTWLPLPVPASRTSTKRSIPPTYPSIWSHNKPPNPLPPHPHPPRRPPRRARRRARCAWRSTCRTTCVGRARPSTASPGPSASRTPPASASPPSPSTRAIRPRGTTCTCGTCACSRGTGTGGGSRWRRRSSARGRRLTTPRKCTGMAIAPRGIRRSQSAATTRNWSRVASTGSGSRRATRAQARTASQIQCSGRSTVISTFPIRAPTSASSKTSAANASL
mmetsp:Transcript_47268/g.107768  ORF Transcript_47268/g.107768 Transcript_47268/m.107768 type:complete len:238 (+) Transcript_47268:364-1077(+)